jgi:hypothetical protein
VPVDDLDVAVDQLPADQRRRDAEPHLATALMRPTLVTIRKLSVAAGVMSS